MGWRYCGRGFEANGGYQVPGTNLHVVPDIWRQCGQNDADTFCRDRFRIELTRNNLTIYVNGYKTAMIDKLFKDNPGDQAPHADNRIPDFWFGPNGVRVYLTSWINNSGGGTQAHQPIRWHWARVVVNPHDASGNFLPPSAAPTYCVDQPQHTCGASSSPPPTPLPSATKSPSPTPSSSPSCPLHLKGDINCDGVIDIYDYNLMLSDFGQVGANLRSDISGPNNVPDGKVDIYDYNVLLSNFGQHL